MFCAFHDAQGLFLRTPSFVPRPPTMVAFLGRNRVPVTISIVQRGGGAPSPLSFSRGVPPPLVP